MSCEDRSDSWPGVRVRAFIDSSPECTVGGSRAQASVVIENLYQGTYGGTLGYNSDCPDVLFDGQAQHSDEFMMQKAGRGPATIRRNADIEVSRPRSTSTAAAGIAVMFSRQFRSERQFRIRDGISDRSGVN